jgi:large subunit ribosomal protein L9
MQILMLKDVSGVGNKGQIKEVKEGYAFNYLLPNKLAVLADPKTVKNFKILEQSKKDRQILQQELCKKNIENLSGKEIIIKAKANEKGHLFKAVRIEDIISTLNSDFNLVVDSDWFPKNLSIKELGEHKIEIEKLNLKTDFLLKIVSE